MLSLAVLCALFSLFTLFAFSAFVILYWWIFCSWGSQDTLSTHAHCSRITFFLFYNVYSCMNQVFNSLCITIPCSLLGLKIGPHCFFFFLSFFLGLCCSEEGCIVVLGFFIQRIFTIQQSVQLIYYLVMWLKKFF